MKEIALNFPHICLINISLTFENKSYLLCSNYKNYQIIAARDIFFTFAICMFPDNQQVVRLIIT